jgi:hypothetical protein
MRPILVVMLPRLVDRADKIVQGRGIDAFQATFLVDIIGAFFFKDIPSFLEGYLGGLERV